MRISEQFCLVLALSLAGAARAQNIGINVNGASPNASALLDIDVSALAGTKRGLLIPRMTVAEMNAIVAPATSLLVFNTTANNFFYFNGTVWVPLGTAAGWGLTGNAGTNPATNFIGTMDAQPLRFRANNTWAGSLGVTAVQPVSYGRNAGLTSTGIQNTFIGASAGAAASTSNFNTMVGHGAGTFNTTGSANVMVGNQAGSTVSTGHSNVMVGHLAGQNVTTGFQNVLVGAQAGQNVAGVRNVMVGDQAGGATTTGSGNVMVGMNTGGVVSADFNVMIGAFAGQTTTSGADNVFIGRTAGTTNSTGANNVMMGFAARPSTGALSNASAIGAFAEVGGSNSMVLGSISGVNAATANTNVGIGTTTPSDRLHVVGSIRMVDGNQAIGRVLTSDANGTATWQAPAASDDWGLLGNSGTSPAIHFLGTADNQHLVLRANNTEMIRLNTAGRVEIGTGGSAVANVPSIGLPKLWVASANTLDDNIIFQASHNNPASSAAFVSAKSNGTLAAPTAVVAGESMGRWATVGYGTASFLPAAGIRVVAEGAPLVTHVPSRINFETDNEVQRMTIRSGGNVGINTLDPLDRLHVVGNIRMVDGNQAAGRVLTSDANGTATWQNASANAWGLLGNAGTNPATNFIGTTDAQDLRFRAGNASAGQIGNTANEMVALGLAAGNSNFGLHNTFLGADAGTSNTSGSFNTMIGNGAGASNTNGSASVYLGTDAGSLSTGSFNVMVGRATGQSNTSGSGNVMLGNLAGTSNITGTQNTFIGTESDATSGALSNATAIGYLAAVSANNSMVLGSINGVNAATANTNVGIGVTAPLTRLDIDGGLTIRRPAIVAIVPGANAVAVGDRSYLRLNSAAPIASATIDLGNGLATGQVLVVECTAISGLFGFTIADNNNTLLNGDHTLNPGDSITLIWNGSDWLELARSTN